MSKIRIDTLTEMCDVATTYYCNTMKIPADQINAYEAVMFYLGHPMANPAQWHEEWIKLRAAEGFERFTPDDDCREGVKVDPRMKPLAELGELEQIKYVVFLNMFRTLRQLL